MSVRECRPICRRVEKREQEYFIGIEPRSSGNDQNRQEKSGTEDCDRNSPREEPRLPHIAHTAQYLGIDDRIVERERGLEYGKQADECQSINTSPGKCTDTDCDGDKSGE